MSQLGENKMESKKSSRELADELILWVREYASLHIDSHAADEQRGYPPHVLLELGNKGFFGIHISQNYGGLELDTSDMLRVIEQVAAIDLTLSVILIESIQGAHTLERYATQSMKDKYLPLMATGRVFTAGAMTESDAGSNPRAMKSVAISQENGDWLITGSKRWIGMGSSAAITAVYVQQYNQENHWEGMSGFLIPQGAEGLHVGFEDYSMGIRGFSKNKLTFDRVKASSEQLLGCVGGGMEIAQDNMMYIRLCLAAATIGAMKRCVQLMHRYAERRIIATGMLLDNPVTLVRLSEITAVISALETFVSSVAGFYDQDPALVPEEAFVVSKILGSECLGWVADQALQLLGARGYEAACDISKIFRDARVFRIFEGPTEALTMYLGSRLLTPSMEFERFVCETLGQKTLYEQMKQAIAAVQVAMQGQKAQLFDKAFTKEYWAQALIGDIVCYGLLLSCLQYTQQTNKSPLLERSVLWANSKYDEMVQKALAFSSGEQVLMHPQQLKALVASYTSSIGNIDQVRRANNISIDPLLQIHEPAHVSEFVSQLGHELFPKKSTYKEHVVASSKVNEEERSRLLHEWNNVEHATSYPNQCVQQVFEDCVLNNPHAIAVTFNDKTVSYQELNEQANQVAHYLVKEGVGTNDLVALYFERSIEMIIGLLGVLKSGAAYLPLDYNYPEKSVQHMLEDSGAVLILSQEKLLADSPFENKKIIAIEYILDNASVDEKHNYQSDVSLNDLGYVIYTSGSTGQPKGVMLPHRALSNLMFWHRQHIGDVRNVLQFTTINFDMSFIEIFSALNSGGTLTLISEEDRLNVVNFAHTVQQNKVEQLVLSVPFLKNLVDSVTDTKFFECVKEIIIAGEQLVVTEDMVSFFKQLNNCTLCNYYGPSETHVVTAYTFPKNPKDWPDYPPIGKAISNTKIVILDENLQLVPIGTQGEIYIGGDCLASGYLHRAELTQEKFIKDPFDKGNNNILYRSGDYGKYLSDGTLVYIGRKDEQLKIRGYRIEPKEIEWHIEKHEGIKEAVVIAKKGRYLDKHLEAFLVVNEPVNDSFLDELYTYLQDRLPPQMLPSVFNLVDHIPLTNSGKVDRIALEKFEGEQVYSVSQFKEPGTETEKAIVSVMEDVFKIKIGINQSFISIGGNSLLAMQIVTKLKEKCLINLPAYFLLSDPTLADTAKRIDGLKG